MQWPGVLPQPSLQPPRQPQPRKALGIEFTEEQLAVIMTASEARLPEPRLLLEFGPKSPVCVEPQGGGTGACAAPPQKQPEALDAEMQEPEPSAIDELSLGSFCCPRRLSRGGSKEQNQSQGE